MYSREIVTEKTLEYFKGDSLATNVWIDKYCLRNKEGEFLELSPDDMHRRMAKEFHRIELNYPNPLSYEDIYYVFKNFKYIIPQGRVMAGLGAVESFRSLSNCLVLPTPKDSYSSIMYVDTCLVSSAKRGCGYGIDLSKLRPKDSPTKNASNTSTGIIPFMERYSNSTREVGQSGRRGACLLGLDIKHPQSLDFAKSKHDKTKITGANISLKVDDKFFNSVIRGEQYSLEFNNKIYGEVDAKKYWNSIINNVKLDSEPGIFMWDTINNYDPVSVYDNHKIALSNACGEQPMGIGDSCRLIVINLYSLIKHPFTNDASIDVDLFNRLVYIISNLADDLVDLEIEYIDRIISKIELDPEPMEEKIVELSWWKIIKEKAISGRRVGMGITGLADMLAALNIRYGSEESIEIINWVFNHKLKQELKSQIRLAEERGVFPDWNPTLENPDTNGFYKLLFEEYNDLWNSLQTIGRRSINWSTIAPTGSVSLLTQTSSGCEPVYQLHYKRRKKVEETSPNKSFQDKNGDWWEEYIVYHPKYQEWSEIKAKELGIDITQAEWGALVEHSFNNPYHKSTAYELDPIQRVKIQATLQKYTTSAISSTINLNKNTTVEEISNLYLEAWKLGCKGLTVYLEGSRDGVLISNDNNKDIKFSSHDAPKRPKDLKCNIFTIRLNNQQYVVAIGLMSGRPYEVFAFKFEGKFNLTEGFIRKLSRGRYDILTKDKNIYYENITSEMSQVEEGTTRLVSTSLRHGADIKFLVEQLLKAKGNGFQDFSKVIARVLKKYITDNTMVTGTTCDNCGSTDIVYKDGCQSCISCGNSKCS